jgi:hypothetical protein
MDPNEPTKAELVDGVVNKRLMREEMLGGVYRPSFKFLAFLVVVACLMVAWPVFMLGYSAYGYLLSINGCFAVLLIYYLAL